MEYTFVWCYFSFYSRCLSPSLMLNPYRNYAVLIRVGLATVNSVTTITGALSAPEDCATANSLTAVGLPLSNSGAAPGDAK